MVFLSIGQAANGRPIVSKKSERFVVIANQWCSAQRILNIHDCQWQSYHDIAQTGVAIRLQSLPLWGGAPRSESKSNNCQWQLLHNVKVARASHASARRMRAKNTSQLYHRADVGIGPYIHKGKFFRILRCIFL